MSPLDNSPEAKAKRKAEKEELRKQAEGYALPMPEKLERKHQPPEREILTARETLERERGNRSPAKFAAKVLAGLVAVVLLLGGAFALASALDDSDPPKSAVWGTKSAPDVKPDRLTDQ